MTLIPCKQSDRSDKLQVTQTGTGGLTELRDALDDSKASYAYARVSYSNDKESTREKFILVVRTSALFPLPAMLNVFADGLRQVWIGPQCKVMRKAKASL